MPALHSSENPDLNFTPYPLVAIDTETTPFNPPEYAYAGRTRIKPFGGHDLVLGSIATAGKVEVHHARELLELVRQYLAGDHHIVFHNCAFDIPVLIKADQTLREPFIHATDKGRLHDTMVLEPLLQIAHGSRTVDQAKLVFSPSLKKLALSRAALDLNKAAPIRLGFAQFRDPRAPIPIDYLRYAAQDSVATYLIFKSQYLEALVHERTYHGAYPRYNAESRRDFGLLSERIQIQGALAFAWLEQFPLRVDIDRAEELKGRLEDEARRLECALVDYGWATRGPKTGKFRLRFKTMREVLTDYAQEKEILPEYTDTGLLALSHDFWSKFIGKITKEEAANPQNIEDGQSRLRVWLRYNRARKLLTTYVYPYSSAQRHYPHYSNFGARTGRTSCRKPNAQNIPKRRDGIRALFIPEDDHIFIEADWQAAELVALAQIYHSLYGGSELETAINAGIDPHVATARRLNPGFDNLPPPDQKRLRQAAKAVNFGLPGGLGAKTFHKYANKAFQIDFSFDEIRELRQLALRADPQLATYLSERDDLDKQFAIAAKNLALPGGVLELAERFDCLASHAPAHPKGYIEHLLQKRLISWANDPRNSDYTIPTPTGFNPRYDLKRRPTTTLTGRIRGRASFTEAHNTPFQGLVADAGKIALWNLYKIWSPDSRWRPVAFVHDSILIQSDPDAPHVDRLLTDCMEAALTEVCPDIKNTAKADMLPHAWGPNTNPWGEEIE